MGGPRRRQLRWVKQVQVPAAPAPPGDHAPPTARERLVAALADRPRTVAQLAQTFGLSQPTMLEQVRRALRDGLVVEVRVPEAEKRFPAERYYAPAVPVIRQPDRELLESACRALAQEIGAALAQHRGDLEAAFALTILAREGWRFDDLWPYLYETIHRLALDRLGGFPRPTPLAPHGLAWVEEVPEGAPAPGEGELAEATEEESA
ncbi:MAG TPA: hypothetical protein VFL91_32180 [Thermomicrobiales bacterium]|nr:hypothetical protein [Thermomicrobiales bacterium]